MSKIEDQLSRMQKSFEEGMKGIREEATRLEDASHAATGGKAMPITPCKYADRTGAYIYSFAPGYSTSYYGSSRVNWKAAAAAARDYLATARKDLEAQHEANLPAIENNRKVIEQVKLIMANLGIPQVRTTWSYATTRAKKMTQKNVRAGFMDDLDAACPVLDNYESCKQRLADFERRIESYEREEAAKEAAAERETQKAQAERAKLTLLGALAHKYGASPDSYDIIEAMGRKNKYFYLAYWLQRNRNNWNEGYSHAQTGLHGFTVETPEDQEIYDDIEARITDWDGDGRTFRDSPYGYDFLFGKVDADLMADYQSMSDAGLISED